MKSGVYIIKNEMNGKIYIGATRNFEKRVRSHLYALESNTHHNKKLQDDWNLFGSNTFYFQFLQDCDESELLKLERNIIEASIDICYNHYRKCLLGPAIKKEEKLSKRNVGQRWVRKCKGFYFDKARNKWRAQIRINGKKTNLGYYETPEEAALAYQEAKRIYH